MKRTDKELMKLLVLLFSFFSIYLFANTEVIEVIEQGKSIKVRGASLANGKNLCVYHQQEAISCGKIEECTGDSCVVSILEQVEDVLVGDGARPYEELGTKKLEAKIEAPLFPEKTNDKVSSEPLAEPPKEWDPSQKPQSRLEIVKYHRELIKRNSNSKPESLY